MRKVELAQCIAKEVGIDNTLSNQLVNEIIREISKNIDRNRTISIRGFGTFSLKHYRVQTNATILKNKPNAKSNENTVFSRPKFKAGSRLRVTLRDKVFN